MDANKRNEFNAAFGAFIKEARVSKGIYQGDVSKHIGVTQSYYSYIENGTRNIDLQLAIEICNYLGLDLSEFVKAQSNG